MGILAALWPRLDAARVAQEHGPAVYRRLKRIFGPEADVDDAYQSVFVEVLRSLPSYAGRARLGAWIRRITYNVAYQEMRLRYRQPELVELKDAAASCDDPSVELERREAMRMVYRALGELTPSLRLVLVLHDIEGLTLKEISIATGRPVPTVASRLAAARAGLARVVAEVVSPGSFERAREVES